MKEFFKRLVWVFFPAFIVNGCLAQNNRNELTKIDRPAAVAGSFYPGKKDDLLKMLEGFFKVTEAAQAGDPIALIVPHAGYVFSGSVAASGYRQINREKKFDHVFILGSSHTTSFRGAAVYSRGDFITPLGKVTVDTLAQWLDTKYDVINDLTKPHESEHSIEVQLPFLQFWLKKDFTIVPIIIGGEERNTSEKLAAALKPFFNKRNLFVISTDFSHYPDYQDAVKSDKIMADALMTNSPEIFMKAKTGDESGNTPGLVTAMCGWTSVLTLLYMTENNPDIIFRKIEYKNSGDTDYGDKERVVGYNSISVMIKNDDTGQNEFRLNDAERIQLLKIARQAIVQYFTDERIPAIEEKTLAPALHFQAGAFVTIMESEKLRGCIGNMQSDKPLYQLIQSLAIASSTRDYRFEPVTKNEVPELELEISVLTPMKKIKSIDEIELGKHGIYIQKGNYTGTFLPQVATETKWTKEEFLGHCARDKAGIGWDGWKDAVIYTYEALVFSEKEYKDILK
jgi:AmmeMemoRadiSam system protein B/AmmeMemoRadiSam system protein A